MLVDAAYSAWYQSVVYVKKCLYVTSVLYQGSNIVSTSHVTKYLGTSRTIAVSSPSRDTEWRDIQCRLNSQNTAVLVDTPTNGVTLAILAVAVKMHYCLV